MLHRVCLLTACPLFREPWRIALFAPYCAHQQGSCYIALGTSAWLFVQHFSRISSCVKGVWIILSHCSETDAAVPRALGAHHSHKIKALPSSSRAVSIGVIFFLFFFLLFFSLLWRKWRLLDPDCVKCYAEVDERSSAANSPPFNSFIWLHAVPGRSGISSPQHTTTLGRRRDSTTVRRHIWLPASVTSAVSTIECSPSRLYAGIWSSSLSFTFFLALIPVLRPLTRIPTNRLHFSESLPSHQWLITKLCYTLK